MSCTSLFWTTSWSEQIGRRKFWTHCLPDRSKQSIKHCGKRLNKTPKALQKSGAIQAMEVDVQFYGKAAFASDDDENGGSP